MACRDRIESYLQEQGIQYELERHRQAFTAQEVAESEHIPGSMLAKVVVLATDAGLAMAVLPAPEHVDLDKAAGALGVESARLATEGEFASTFSDCEIGAMPAFGNLYGVPVVFDLTLAKNDEVVTQAGTHTETVRVAYADLERLVHPKVTDITAD